MQENNTRLIDEALSAEPIKNTFRLGWEFVTLNKKFTYISLAIAVGMNLLSYLDPSLAFFVMLIYGFYMIAVQIEVGRVIHGTQNIETFIADVEAVDVKNVIKGHVERAIGSVIGWSLVYTGVMVLFAVAGFMIYAIIGSPNETLVLTLIPAGVLLLLVAYLQPLIQAKVALSANIEEAMFSVFSIVKPELRIRAFSKSYFKYVASLLFVLLAIPFALTMIHGMGLFSSVPLLNEILMIFLPMAVYVTTVIMSVGYMMSARMVGEV
ncbi:MAG: Unknown protein [uncultured Sulfurovum sp.]|uniref:Uncharacterized protein n=1 Tax=uncultured Sulfurovum sp. TaxID=269237 RepID=A0A6S6UB35_9BACT|nr:MAG: Unknown protein [uncultured Sulfurovum sp.]